MTALAVIPVIVASDQGGMVPLIVIFGAGAVMLAVTPITASIAWLKGKRVWAVTGLIAGLMALVVLASRGAASDVIPYADAVPMVAAPVALVTAVAAIRLARPGSWWARRFYDTTKLERARWAYGTTAGRRRRLWSLAATTLAIALGMAAVPLILAGVNDMLNTTYDELYSDVALYVANDDPTEIEQDLLDSGGPGLVSVSTESRSADLGEDSATLLSDPLVAGCLLHEATHTIWLTVEGANDAAVDTVISEVGEVPGLVWVDSERGNPDRILGVPHLNTLNEDWDFCQTSTMVAHIAGGSTDAQRHELAENLRHIPGVLAVAEPVWRIGEEDFARFPALVECYGPTRMDVLIDGDVADVESSVSSALATDPLVDLVSGPNRPDDDGHFDEALIFERPECFGHDARLLVDPGLTDPQAAAIVAAATAAPSVARATLQLTVVGQECIEDCDGESGIEILLGDPSTEGLEALAESVCGLEGVIGLVVYEGEGSPPCPALWLQARIAENDSGQVEAVEDILAGSASVVRTWTYEREDENGPTSLYGSRDPVGCDLDGAFTWRVNADLVRGDETELTRLITGLRVADGVIAVVGTATVLPGDPGRCGHPGVMFWLGVDSTSSDHESIAATLSQFPSVFAVELTANRTSVATNEGDVETSAELEIWFVDEARDDLLEVMSIARESPAIVDSLPMDSYGWGHRP